MARTYTVTLDLYTQRSQKKPKIEYVEGDAGSELIINLRNGSSAYNLSDALEVIVSCVLPSGDTVYSAAAITSATGGTLKYTFVGSELAEVGSCLLSVRVVSEGSVSTTFQTVWYKVIERVGDDSEIEAQPEYDILLQLIAEVEALDPIPGPQGERGPQGEQGRQGETGPAGPQGVSGTNGTNGTTPTRGVDYWTPEDQATIVAAVIAGLPNGDGVGY